MPSLPLSGRRLVPNSGVVVDIVNLIAIDEHQSVALADIDIEGILILVRRHSMSSNPCRSIRDLLPYCGVVGGIPNGITTDVHQSISLRRVAIECSLVVGSSHAVPGHPWTGWALVPDGDVVVDSVDGVTVHERETVTLGCVLIKIVLVVVSGHAMVGDPPRRGFLDENRGVGWIIVNGVAANPSKAIALGSQLVEGVLILRGGVTVNRLPLGSNRKDYEKKRPQGKKERLHDATAEVQSHAKYLKLVQAV